MDLRSKPTLLVFFTILAFVAGSVTTLVVGGGTTELAAAVGAGAVISVLLLGVYTLGARAGHPHSHAVAETAVALGVVYSATLVMRLLTQDPFGKRAPMETGAGLLAALVVAGAIVGLTAMLDRYSTSG